MAAVATCGTFGLIQSSFGARSDNFEALVLEADDSPHGPGTLMHYWRDNSAVSARYPVSGWNSTVIVSAQASAPASLMQSSFGQLGLGNFEALVLEGNALVHYWRDNQAAGFPWYRSAVVSERATGPASLIQSYFGLDESGNGNFETLVLEGSDLVHYWRDNQTAGVPWRRGVTVSSRATGPAPLILSSFGNFETLVLEGNDLVHYWRDNQTAGFPWHRGVTVSSRATGPAPLIQSLFGTEKSGNGNFETLVLEGQTLLPYWRNNSVDGFPWYQSEALSSLATGSGVPHIQYH